MSCVGLVQLKLLFSYPANHSEPPGESKGIMNAEAPGFIPGIVHGPWSQQGPGMCSFTSWPHGKT